MSTNRKILNWLLKNPKQAISLSMTFNKTGYSATITYNDTCCLASKYLHFHRVIPGSQLGRDIHLLLNKGNEYWERCS